jgi:membrane associated rhomboid family serine protease
MIPLRDTVRASRRPLVNYAVIAACAVVFVLQVRGQGDPNAGGDLVERYGMIPARVIHPDRDVIIQEQVLVQRGREVGFDVVSRPAAPSAVPPWLTLLTCIFLHGGWLHFLGNMWFLFVFGDNVEDRFGHLGYLAFYVASGVAASAVHLVTNLDSTMPTIGASGAIAGVMGGYFLLFPHAKVVTLIPLIIIFEILILPAPIFLGIWFVLQFFQGAFSLAGAEAAGVAWWAHVGGFVAGFLMTLPAKLGGRRAHRGAFT